MHPTHSLISTQVVAHCDNALDWLCESLPAQVSKVTVYTKCNQPISVKPVPAIATVTKLENVGRCDHTFAHHMAHMGDDDPFNIVVFMKDSTYRGTYKKEYENAIRSLDDTALIALSQGFGCGERPATQHLDDVPLGNALSLYHSFDLWTRFQMNVYNRDLDAGNGRSAAGGGFVSQYCSLGEFYDALPLPVNWQPGKYVPSCYGGVFAVRKERIHSLGKAFWSRIEEMLSRGDNIQEGHYMERSWAMLLSPKLSKADEKRLAATTKCAKNDDAYSLLRSGILETVWA